MQPQEHHKADPLVKLALPPSLIILLIASAFGAGIVGGVLSLPQSADAKDLVSLFSAIGTVASAFATFLTVQEMRRGRVSGARARITPAQKSIETTYLWTIKPKNEPPTFHKSEIKFRNSSQGSAKNIHATWKIENPITEEEFQYISSILPPGKRISVSKNRYAIEFYEADKLTGGITVNGKTTEYLGDLGQNQELSTDMPVEISNYAFIKWLYLIKLLSNNVQINTNKIPTFSIIISHDSTYETNIQDHHTVRFHLVRYRFTDSKNTEFEDHMPEEWSRLSIELSAQTTSRDVDEKQKIII